MKIQLAHIREQGIDFAVFNADAKTRNNSGRAELLDQLTGKARASGLKIQKSALAYKEGGRIQFYGTPDLVKFLANNPAALRWTHEIDA